MPKKEPVIYKAEDFDEEKVSVIAELRGILEGIIPEDITDKEIRTMRLEERRGRYNERTDAEEGYDIKNQRKIRH